MWRSIAPLVPGLLLLACVDRTLPLSAYRCAAPGCGQDEDRTARDAATADALEAGEDGGAVAGDASSARDAQASDTGSSRDATPPPDSGFPDASAPDAADLGPLRLEVTVAGSSEDALQDPGGPMLIAYAWTSIYSEDHWGAIRFQVPTITQSATIEDAWLELFVDSPGEGNPNLRIYVEPTPQPAPLAGTSSDISNRAQSAIGVDWSATNIGDTWRPSPSVATLVRSVVNTGAWTPSSFLMFILDGLPGTNFEYRQWDHTAGAYAARLIILYSP